MYIRSEQNMMDLIYLYQAISIPKIFWKLKEKEKKPFASKKWIIFMPKCTGSGNIQLFLDNLTNLTSNQRKISGLFMRPKKFVFSCNPTLTSFYWNKNPTLKFLLPFLLQINIKHAWNIHFWNKKIHFFLPNCLYRPYSLSNPYTKQK